MDKTFRRRLWIIGASILLAILTGTLWQLSAARSRTYVAAKSTVAMDITESGAGPVRLGMNRSDLVTAIGTPDEEQEGTLKYFGMGLEVFLTRDKVKQVMLHVRTPDADRRGFNNYESFQGKTELGIGAGAERKEVVAAYGEPKEVRKMAAEEALVYNQPNLTFMIDQSESVRTITIRP